MSRLTERQAQSLSWALEQREAGLRNVIAGEAQRIDGEHYADFAGAVADKGDESTADVLVDTENAVMGVHLAELRDIEAARERIKEGRYGICIDCAQEIGFARLAAYPTGKRCALCQEKHERTRAGAVHSSL
jgi:DnaK suppressor protein